MTQTVCRTIQSGALILLILLSACSKSDDAKVIRQLIEKGAGLAEKKQVGDLMAMTADGFSADPGGHGARSAKAILLRAFMHYGKFKIHYPKPTVALADDGNSAAVTVHFLIVRQDQPIPGLKELYDDPEKWIETVGEKADLYKLELSWVKLDGDWLVEDANMS